MKRLCIIGAGPAGMMAAISAKTHYPDLNVILIDSNSQVGKKLTLTGGGRCNVTADVSNEEVVEAIVKNGKFLYSSLTEFNSKSIQSFFINNGCPLKIEDHQRVFPVSNISKDIIQVLLNKFQELEIELLLDTKIDDINAQESYLVSQKGIIKYDYLILATGGFSYKETGSDGSGYLLAKKLGHSITELLPAEVPLVSNDNFIAEKRLQGLSFADVELSIYHKGKVKKRITHDLLFTHFGISGPAALRASFHVQKVLEKENPVHLTIDFLPACLKSEIEQDIIESGLVVIHKKYQLPKRLLDYIVEKTANTDEVVKYLKQFPISVYTTKGFSSAFVTNGGVKIKEVDPKTMYSKITNNLSFCGEILDINAYTGGYNITTAFVTGFVAGKHICYNKNDKD